MGKRKKNKKSTNSLSGLEICIALLGIGVVLTIGIVRVVGFIIIVYLIKKIYKVLELKIQETHKNGTVTPMQKLLNFLHIKNIEETTARLSNDIPKNEVMTEQDAIQELFFANSEFANSKTENTQFSVERNPSFDAYNDYCQNIANHEDYRAFNNYTEITFTGRNFDIPEVQLCAAILLSGSQNGSKIRDDNHYSLYFEGRYGLVNISKLHQWLYEQEYLRPALLSEALSLYKISELKTILESLGLKKGGNKSVLIDRIINGIDDDEKSRIVSQCKHLFLTEKGHIFLEENDDYVMYHKKSYGVSFEEFKKHRFLQGRNRKFYDTIFQSLSECAYIYQRKKNFSKLEMIYFHLSEVFYDEGKYDLSLQYTLYRLYFSTNLSSNRFLFEKDFVEFNGIENCKKRINSAVIFNQYTLNRIIELKDSYNDYFLNVVYNSCILPYCLFDKMDMADAIYDLYNNEYFDAEFYTNLIRTNYEEYIKQFL